MCSRVCGIGPSAADTTRIAPSICAAPVIMFFVVRVTGTVDVGVVTVGRLVLDVRRRDRDAALLLLRRVVDLLEAAGLTAVGVGEHLRDGGRERGLAVVDVTDGADVDVRLVALELLLRHLL